MHVPWHDCDALGVDRTQVGVGQNAHEERLGGLLQAFHCVHGPPRSGPEILRDLLGQPAERQLAQHEVGRLLELADLLEGEFARPESVLPSAAAAGGAGGAAALGGPLGGNGLAQH